MAEPHPYEDQAVLYLLDQLPAHERREFEARLAESAQLRSLLRELEDGSAALALATPRRRPPAQIWKEIENAVAREQRPGTIVRFGWLDWWRYGWAAAAILLVGWVFHAVWLNHGSSSARGDAQGAIHQQPTEPIDVRSVAAAQEERSSVPAGQKNSDQAALEAAGLRRHIADLSNQISHLSLSVVRQQALLMETNRLKFFQLSSASDDAVATNMPLSPGSQRALFFAMARELGWLPPVPGISNFAGIDFVDLRPGSNMVANPQPQIETQPIDSSESSLLSDAGSVPGFQSGTNAFLAFDSTVIGPGTTLSFWSGTDGQLFQLIGNSVQGNNPTIVTVPFSSGNGSTLTVTAGNGSGASNVIGRFPPTPGSP